jgi:hypothetical protein
VSEAETRVPRRLTLVWKRCDDCALVVTPSGERVLLNPLASRVWELIDDQRTEAEIKSLLASGDGSGANVEAVLESMVKARVLTYESFLWAEE